MQIAYVCILLVKLKINYNIKAFLEQPNLSNNRMMNREFVKLQQYSGDDSSSFYRDEESKFQEESYVNNGKWTEEECNRYFVFIHFFQKKLKSKVKRRTNKVFKHMAKYIPSRNPIQCRSHHQKMERRFNDINGIIQHLKKHVPEQNYMWIHQELVAKAKGAKNSKGSSKKKESAKKFKQVQVQTDPILEREIVTVTKCTQCEKQQNEERTPLASKQQIMRYSGNENCPNLNENHFNYAPYGYQRAQLPAQGWKMSYPSQQFNRVQRMANGADYGPQFINQYAHHYGLPYNNPYGHQYGHHPSCHYHNFQ